LELKHIPSGWWYTYPSEKYESQLFTLFPVYGKIKHGPNHQPAIAGHNNGLVKKQMKHTCIPLLDIMNGLV
jgi:hypothetical protein